MTRACSSEWLIPLVCLSVCAPVPRVTQYTLADAVVINSFQAIVPYMGQKKGVLFYGGVSLSKIGLKAPY
jgi:hypothetical protein